MRRIKDAAGPNPLLTARLGGVNVVGAPGVRERIDHVEVVCSGVGSDSACDLRRGGASKASRFPKVASQRAAEYESG
jgi:hypothetical protein